MHGTCCFLFYRAVFHPRYTWRSPISTVWTFEWVFICRINGTFNVKKQAFHPNFPLYLQIYSFIVWLFIYFQLSFVLQTIFWLSFFFLHPGPCFLYIICPLTSNTDNSWREDPFHDCKACSYHQSHEFHLKFHLRPLHIAWKHPILGNQHLVSNAHINNPFIYWKHFGKYLFLKRLSFSILVHKFRYFHSQLWIFSLQKIIM